LGHLTKSLQMGTQNRLEEKTNKITAVGGSNQ
jgi:hypothetical protein